MLSTFKIKRKNEGNVFFKLKITSNLVLHLKTAIGLKLIWIYVNVIIFRQDII